MSPAHLVQSAEALRAAVLRDLPRASVVVLDRDLRIVLAAGGALRQHGFDADQLTGRLVADTLPADRFAELEPHYRAALSGDPQRFDYLTADGTAWYEIDAAPLTTEDGAIAGVIAVSQDVSARRAVETELQESRQWLQDILDSLGTPISVKDADARFAMINRAYELGVGKTREELIGKTVEEVYPAEFAAAYAQDDRRALREGVAVHEERPAPWADGTIHTIAMSRSPLRHADGTVYGLCAAGIDITDRQRAEEELRRLTRQFEATFAAAPIGMALVGLDGRWLRVNRQLCVLTGYAEEELLELSFQDITHPDDLESDLAHMDRLLAGEIDSYSMEKRYFTKAGHLIWVLLSGALVRDDDGRPLHFVAQVQDVSERKRMMARLEELADRDPVTDLLNRRRFEEELRRQVSRCQRYGEQASLLMLDVDRFKSVNDRHGHALGDAALRSIGRILRGRVRDSDIVARIGGDEFAVLLLNIGPAQGRALAEDVRAAIHATPVTLNNQSVHVTVSIGLQPLDATTPDEQLAFAGADGAMYAAKGEGRDRVAVATGASA